MIPTKTQTQRCVWVFFFARNLMTQTGYTNPNLYDVYKTR